METAASMKPCSPRDLRLQPDQSTTLLPPSLCRWEMLRSDHAAAAAACPSPLLVRGRCCHFLPLGDSRRSSLFWTAARQATACQDSAGKPRAGTRGDQRHPWLSPGCCRPPPRPGGRRAAAGSRHRLPWTPAPPPVAAAPPRSSRRRALVAAAAGPSPASSAQAPTIFATACPLPRRQLVNSSITAELDYVSNLVIGVIDVQRGKEKGYETVVKEGLCDELDELRMVYEGLPDFLEQVSANENASFPFSFECRKAPLIVYVHQIGYLMCFFDEKISDALLVGLQDFEFAFFEDGEERRFYYHTQKTRELDNLLGDIYHKILDMERAITRDLVCRVLQFLPQLTKAVNFAAELDCILSLAIVARQNNYVRPILTEDSILDIKNGRHALQEMTVDTFVPNDTLISSAGRINIITGPNYSGKSIYIKQVALVVFLAHIGSFVPADSAIVGLTDRIFCAMGSKSMTTEQSTFMIDLHQVGTMLRHATSRSLCLLDEFGKGTLTEDGIGLLGGTIGHFANYDYPPKILLSTHLTEIFTENYLPQSEHIRCCTMSVLNPDGQTSNENIIFLYRLVPGQALLSFGLHCAQLAGVPNEVVQRAASVLEDIHSKRQIGRMIYEKLAAKDQQYQDAVTKLLAFDPQKGDLNNLWDEIFPNEP